MDKVARKIFLSVLLSGILIFAIDFEHAHMAAISRNCDTNAHSTSLKNLDNDEFWGKFRESVMKDREGKESSESHGDDGRNRGSNHGENGDHDNGGAGQK